MSLPRFIGIACLLLAGCGRSNDGLMVVRGQVSADGNVVPSGTVTFYPDAAKGNATQHQPVGVIDREGRYELYVPKNRPGAPPGWYTVVVYAVDDPQPGKPNRYFVHRKYTDVKTTPLSLEVVAEPEDGRYDLKLRR